MCGHQQRMRVISDLIFRLWVVFSHKRFRVIDQDLPGHASKVIKQFLHSFIDGIRILLKGKGHRLFTGCRKYQCETVDRPLPASHRQLVFRPVELCLVSGRAFMPYCCLPADTASDIFIHTLQITVNRADATVISPSLQFTEDPGAVKTIRFTALFNDLLFKGIDNGMIFVAVVYRFLCHCQKAPDCVPRNSQYGCSCTFRLCLAVHSVYSCPVFQIFHLFLLLSVCLAYRKVFYIALRGGSILSVKFSRYSVNREPGSLTHCHFGWVNFPRKSWVSFNYKSTIL